MDTVSTRGNYSSSLPFLSEVSPSQGAWLAQSEDQECATVLFCFALFGFVCLEHATFHLRVVSSSLKPRRV